MAFLQLTNALLLLTFYPPTMYTGTRHFLPLFLEDRSGQLTGSEFVDVHDRVKLSYRRTRQDQRGTQYCIYETSSNRYVSPPLIVPRVLTRVRDDAMTRPVIALDFGVKGELGSITFTFGKTGRSTRIEEYLRKSNGRCVSVR
jgi:hypothetical protein